MRHFYHATVSLKTWRDVAACHAEALAAGGLAIPTTIGLTGPANLRSEAAPWFEKHMPYVDSFVEQDTGWEHITLAAAREWAMDHARGYVLYAHAKGSYHVREITAAWRECMMQVVAGRWQECVGLLRQGNDVVGAHWVTDDVVAGWPYPCGNFWWARAEYLAGLPVPGPAEDRYSAEAWIGMGTPFYRDLRPGRPLEGHCFEFANLHRKDV
jgi:hypothetical protein